MITIDRIQRETASYFGVPLIEMRSERTSEDAVRARRVAMALARHLTGLPCDLVGQAFHRCAWTVGLSLRAVSATPELAMAFDTICAELRRLEELRIAA
jgi:chromosomal replication initiation ATPase DnaA